MRGRGLERREGALRALPRQRHRVADGAAAGDEVDGALQVAVALADIFKDAPPEVALPVVAAGEGENRRQGDRPLAEIVADGLVQGGAAAVVERVIDELEGDAEMPAVIGQRPAPAVGAVARGGAAFGRRHRADLGGGGEQPRRFRLDDAQAVRLVGRRVVGGEELHHLTLGDDRTRLRQERQHIQRPIFDHQFESAAEQEVADEDARLVAPDGVGGGGAPAQRAVVHHVVVQQGRGVDEFDAGGEGDMARAVVTAAARREQRHQRAQPLAASAGDVPGETWNERDRTLHPVDDDAVDGRQIVARQRVQAVEPISVRFRMVQPGGWRHGGLLSESTHCLTRAGAGNHKVAFARGSTDARALPPVGTAP